MAVARDPISRECRHDFAAYHHSGDRRPASIRYIVLHSTEGDTAKDAASWFQNPNSGGSANLVVDDNTCYQTLRDDVIPWGAPPLNTHGFHIEQAGYARWSRAEWLKHEGTIERAAFKAALRVKWYKIRPVVLDVEALKQDFGPDLGNGAIPVNPGGLNGGIVTHHTVSDAYKLSDHTDPGTGYPIDVFMTHLAHYLDPGNHV